MSASEKDFSKSLRTQNALRVRLTERQVYQSTAAIHVVCSSTDITFGPGLEVWSYFACGSMIYAYQVVYTYI